jgi:hypothetical protein
MNRRKLLEVNRSLRAKVRQQKVELRRQKNRYERKDQEIAQGTNVTEHAGERHDELADGSYCVILDGVARLDGFY